MRKLWLIACFVLILSGCGNGSKGKVLQPSVSPTSSNSPFSSATSSATSNVQQDSPEGFLLVNNREAVFIRWTESDKTATGQLQMFSLQDNNGTLQSTSSSHPFSGTINKENISLNFTGSVWLDGFGGQTWTGTLKDKDNLILVVPSADGKLNTVIFHPGTVQDYNNAVTDLQNSINDANNQSKEQATIKAQQQAEADQISKEQNAASNANLNLTNDINAMNSKVTEHDQISKVFDPTLQSFSDHLTQLREAYAQLKIHSSTSPLTDTMIVDIQTELVGMESIDTSIQSDDVSMGSDQMTLDNYISDLNDLKSNIQNEWALLQKAVSANSSVTPGSMFTQQQIDHTLSVVQDEIDQVNNIAKKKRRSADVYLASSKNIISEASQFVDGLQPTQ